MDALAIQKAYRKVISRYIVNERELTSAASIGDTNISITSSRRFVLGDKVAVIDQATGDAEIVVICAIPDKQTITVETELIGGYPVTGNASTTSIIRKLLGYESGIEAFIQSIYLGDPEVISHYPAITIDLKSRDSEWITLESTKESYTIDISVYVEAADYEAQYELMHRYANAIEQALFRSFYPLVDPYTAGVLAEDVAPDDIIISITEDDKFVCTGNWIWLESVDYLRYNRLSKYLGNGVYELTHPPGRPFSAGDAVITPSRHIYNTLPASTRFGTVNKGTMLKAAVIKVVASEEVWRHQPFVDPLTH